MPDPLVGMSAEDYLRKLTRRGAQPIVASNVFRELAMTAPTHSDMGDMALENVILRGALLAAAEFIDSVLGH